MPREPRDTEPDFELEPPRNVTEREDENQFSQEHDDQAGRIWHGLNSDTEKEQVGRFEEDEDAEAPRPGGTERV